MAKKVHHEDNSLIMERHLPYIRVSFHTEDKCYRAKNKSAIGAFEDDPTAVIQSVNTQKSLSNPAGALTINLTGVDWADKLKSNDLIVVEMGYRNDVIDTVMVGLVDKINTKMTVSGGKAQTDTRVTARDFGKVFVQSNIKFYPQIGATDKGENFFLTEDGWVSLMSYFTNDQVVEGTPATLIDIVLRFLMQKLFDVEWTVYDEKGATPKKKKVAVANIIRYTLERIDLFLPMMLTADQFEGSLWNLMERMAPKPFFELFIDVRKPSEAYNDSGKNRVVVRSLEQVSNKAKSLLSEKEGKYPYPAMTFGEDGSKVVLSLRTAPFSTADRKKLVTHRIKAIDVLSQDLERSDEEHYNLFWAGTMINPLGIDLKRIFPPMMNEKDVKRYGLSPLEKEIEGMTISRDDKDKNTVVLESISNKYTAMLKAWFEKNHEYLSGTLTLRGKGSIKVGQRLILEDRNLEFYIEGVSQTFTVYRGWTTNVEVTRGMPVNAKIDPESQERDLTPQEPKPAPGVEIKEHYTVVSGDTLWAIAGKFYNGRNTDWRKIWEANKEMLIERDKRNATNHGHWIYPGQKLRIPK